MIMKNPFNTDEVVVRRAPTQAVEAFKAAPDDTILRIKKHFGGEKVYTYSLLKAGGRWYATGQIHAGKGMNPDQVFEFLIQGYLVSVEIAQTFQTIEV
jgi:hypothetical protein